MNRKNVQKTALTTSAVLAGMALGVSVNQSGVHADTTTNAATTATTDTNQQLANLKSQQTANESAVASSNAATMSAATSAANSQVADLNNQIKARQASDAAAQQNKIDQVNKDAQAATNAENGAYSSAVTKQKAANDAELKDAQAKIVTEQQKEQETAQENIDYQKQVSSLNSEHKATLNKLDQDLKNNTDGTNAAIQKEVSRQKAAQQSAINQTAKEFDNQIADANLAVNDAQKAVNDDQQDVNAKNVANTAAQQAVKNAQDKLSSLQSALNSAQKSINDVTTDSLNVPQDYINVWKDYYQNIHSWDLTKDKNPDLWNRNHNASIEAKKLNSDTNFCASTTDKHTLIHFNQDGTLSRDDEIIATQYAAELINPIRKAIGVNPLKITNASIDITAENASKYRAKGHNDFKVGHDNELIKQIAQEWGCDDIGESLCGNYSLARAKNPTVADLKKTVYNAIIALLFEGSTNGSDNGHTTDLLGVRYTVNNNFLGGCDFLGVTYDIDPINRNGWIRFNSIGDGKGERAQRMRGYGTSLGSAKDKSIQGDNYTQIAVPTPGEATKRLEEKIANLKQTIVTDQQALNDAKSKANTAASELKSAQDKLASDSAKLSQAQDHINDLKANKDKTLKAMATDPMQSPAVKKLQNKLSDVKQEHSTAVKAENDQYAAKVNDLKSKHEAKLAEIAAQPTSLAELQNQLQAKLDTLKANHDAKLKQITDDANAKIAAIKNQKVDDPEIDKLNAQIDQIKNDLAKKQQELDSQYEALKTKNQAEYDALANKLNPSTKAVINDSTQQVFTSRSGKVAYVVPSHQSIATNSVKTNSNSDSNELLSKESNNDTSRLPQTGNNSSLAMVLLGAAAAMFGFGLAGKKRM
ncbi:SEC10/PgrA surface exclusion domain-containing protein [Limosilactobacillus reuteri]|uniref:SEC10/PgrA surface exclusion domain-containing protein n=1 Tax=Limosilactobacillus reuteri TaxID=1598 RepID=UPI001E4192F2|nr:SEC10/PgrA surface exclusion domain-containing protein [Limosilactobacillus reuteri]MCC4435724.1 SEC10/PgrA surface exclusion domain-containing protein [Limosilactobacillus reuteri]MCC4437867.1 SEC10/PgrA surface exclusion domain-containing protein [Limosilactobacillus reuteri]MCC4441483.1 SEC10/PgrA surface exclusion domain-containing protein [Limosilactobacillus reuteri]MCC4444721.1 SEC10/PgrA surface exclusion domain-containing protein [Limosilactobacillus reuteri]MCC4445738.1 SEC10/PgrA